MTSALLFALLLPAPAEAARVKDIAELYGVRENTLTGYGLVVGLNRTGDSAQNAASVRLLAARLKGIGVSISESDIKSRNVAVVMVSATLPSGVRSGSRLDLQVSALGDAKSLEGGTLAMTTLVAPNGEAMGSAFGSVTVGGYSIEAGGSTQTKNHPTVGTVSRGGTVEREVPNALNVSEAVQFEWVLNSPDFTNSTRLATVVNATLGPDTARAVDSGTVLVQVPDAFLGRQAELIATVEALDVSLDHVNRVVINERTGTVVMGAGITISPVAVAHGGLSIEVSKQNSVSQPGAFSGGSTQAVSNTSVNVKEEAGKVSMVSGATVGDMVGALNAMGVSPRDLIVVLQSIRAAGGIHAEIETL